jgi:hypothetical protein
VHNVRDVRKQTLQANLNARPLLPQKQQLSSNSCSRALSLSLPTVIDEEGTWPAWLYDLLKPHVTTIVVCNPRRNALLKEGNKSDRIDARKLSELLRGNLLKPVYHGETGLRTMKESFRVI